MGVPGLNRYFLLLACLFVLGVALRDSSVSSAHGLRDTHSPNDALYIVFEISDSAGVRPVHAQTVALAAPLVSLPAASVEKTIRTSGRDSEAIAFRLEGAAGQAVFRGVAAVPSSLRGEFHGPGPGQPIDGHRIRPVTRHFVVRVPTFPGATLVLTARGTDHRFDTRSLSPQTGLPSASASSAGIQPPPGPPANRVDLLIMGDGYTAAESGKFASDASAAMSTFFNITPYAEYANYVNVQTFFTPSNQSGADHPPYVSTCSPNDTSCCGDPLMQSDPLRGTFRDTRFGARFCTYNIHRLLTVDEFAVFAAAAATPDWDHIMVIVNDTTYGGSGGPVAVFSLNSLAVGIAQHEYGHSFTLLADEYEDPYPGYPACSDINGPLCEPNVTDQSNRASIKWLPWISAQTPTPTPENQPQYYDVVGLFEGARFLSTGMYRSGHNCLMRSLGRPFCQVPSQAYVLRLYDGGWGVPSSGIDIIEPGTENPPPGDIFAEIPGPVNITFSAAILQPVGGPAHQLRWYVNGALDPAAQSNTYSISAALTTDLQVQIQAADVTPLVHPLMADTSLESSRTWRITDPDDDNDGICDTGGPLPNGTPGTPAGGCAAGPTTACSTYTSADVPKSIPDLGSVTSILNVSDSFSVADVDAGPVNITHTWDADLEVRLRSPAGTLVELFTRVGSSGDNFTNTILDDEAATAITDGTAPFVGSYRPEGSLSSFDGQNSSGQWGLEIADVGQADVGTLTSWQVRLCHSSDNCPATTNADQTNIDGDPRGDACDNCPAVANADQADADLDVLGDVCDPCPATTDCDGDGWKDGSEVRLIGTDPLDACPDDLADDAWPPDINNNREITGFDLSAIAFKIGQNVPPAPPRVGIAPDPPDGSITGADLQAVASRIGRVCAQ